MLSVQYGCATLHASISQVRRRLWRRPRRRLWSRPRRTLWRRPRRTLWRRPRRGPGRSISALTVWFVLVLFAYLKRVDDDLQTVNSISYEL